MLSDSVRVAAQEYVAKVDAVEMAGALAIDKYGQFSVIRFLDELDLRGYKVVKL